MKKILLLIACISTSFQLFSQINEGIRNMSQGDKNAFSTTITGIDGNNVEKLWKKYVDQFDGKDKYNKKTKELFVDNATIKSMSANTIDIYSRANQVGENVEFSVWFDLGGAYLSGALHPDKVESGQSIVSGFLKEVDKYKINEKLAMEEKKLKSLNDDLKSLTKDKEGYEKEIKKAEEKIKESNDKIAKNTTDQSNKQGEINAQQQVIDSIKEQLSRL